jgi:RNA polymerase sigma factor for flagellar operon FliA
MNFAQRSHSPDNDRSRDARLTSHLTLVHHVARQVSGTLSTRMEMAELVSFGTLGLIEALESFDASRGLAFSTYAVPRIRGAILDELRRQDHVPRSVRRKARALAGARESLSRVFGRIPQDDELAEYLGIDVPTLWRWETDAAGSITLSLEPSTGDDSSDSVSDHDAVGVVTEPTIEDDITRQQEIAIMAKHMAGLKEQERQVLALYYHEELKMHEIAEVLGVTESRISQIRTRALAKLRAKMAPLRGLAVAK